MEQNWCVPGERPTRFPVTNVPPLNWNKDESMGKLTDFKQHVGDTEFQTGELIVIEIPI